VKIGLFFKGGNIVKKERREKRFGDRGGVQTPPCQKGKRRYISRGEQTLKREWDGGGETFSHNQKKKDIQPRKRPKKRGGEDICDFKKGRGISTSSKRKGKKQTKYKNEGGGEGGRGKGNENPD